MIKVYLMGADAKLPRQLPSCLAAGLLEVAMDNVSRSERSRNAIIQAALAIIARDGPGRLTLDAIAREGGLSKGGVMHQFRTKEAVLKTLLENQVEFFENFSRDYLASAGADDNGAQLAAQIAVQRKAIAETAFGGLWPARRPGGKPGTAFRPAGERTPGRSRPFEPRRRTPIWRRFGCSRPRALPCRQ